MENGEWRMENGEWRMENGEWRIGIENVILQMELNYYFFIIGAEVFAAKSQKHEVRAYNFLSL